MKTFTEQEKNEWIKTLPRKRFAAEIILKNQDNEWLLVKTGYHKGKYTFVGGHAEEYESPKKTAERETQEEIGLCVSAGALLACTYVSNKNLKDEIIIFYFDGGTIDLNQVENIVCRDGEIEEFIFVSEEDVMKYLRPELRDTYEAIKESCQSGKTVFLEFEK